MPTPSLRAVTLILIAALTPNAALAVTRPFTGPAGWEHTVGATSTAALPRAQETWKKNDGEQLTYLADGGLTFDDMVGQVKKNIADNNMKPSVAKDRTCAGRRAYEIELSLGPSIVHQIIVDDAPGVTKVTYVRAQGMPPSAEVSAMFDTYCAS
jgi:hypothetical protein